VAAINPLCVPTPDGLVLQPLFEKVEMVADSFSPLSILLPADQMLMRLIIRSFQQAISHSQAEDASAWSFILALAVSAWATRWPSLSMAMGLSVASSIVRQSSSRSDRPPVLAWRAWCSSTTVSGKEFQSVRDLQVKAVEPTLILK
jgi:hypothetical protein